MREASLTATGGIFPTQQPGKHFYSAGITQVLGSIRSACCYYRYCSGPLASHSWKRMYLFQMGHICRPETQLQPQSAHSPSSITPTAVQHYLHLPALLSVEG